jgi:riboflavin kinase/FMN adenylyltransferase
MQHYWSLEHLHLEDSWLSIGTFDGVHLGHQEIIRQLTTGAKENQLTPVVVTFFPHPARVLGKREGRFYLSTPEERAEDLGQLGVEIVVTHPFNLEIARLSAKDFVERLKRHLGFRRLIVGYDFALGKNREGDVNVLRELGNIYDYEVQVVPAVRINGEVVSSSLLRDLLASGNIAKANRLLGKSFRLRGEVVRGDGRGQLLGIPTANLDVLAERVVPLEGVYACRAWIGNLQRGAVVNIGVRPTFEDRPVAPRVEAHLLDFEGDVYGTQITLEFIERLREEKRFPSKEALVQQIQKDIESARKILNNRIKYI